MNWPSERRKRSEGQIDSSAGAPTPSRHDPHEDCTPMTDCFTVRPGIPPGKPLPFSAVPHALRRDPKLIDHPRAIILAATLLEYCRDKPSCYPSNRRLAEDMGVCPRTIQNALAALRDANWIKIEHGPSGRT